MNALENMMIRRDRVERGLSDRYADFHTRARLESSQRYYEYEIQRTLRC